MKIKSAFHYFSKGEILLWTSSVIMIVSSFIIFDRENYITLIASLIGVTSLIFNAKGNPFGQSLIDSLQFVVWDNFIYFFLLR